MSVSRLIRIGRWSEPKVVLTSQEAYGRMGIDARVMSGEVGC